MRRRLGCPAACCVGAPPQVHFDAVAFALAKALAPLNEALDFDRLPLCREGRLQEHVQGAGEGNEAQELQELAAVALASEEVLGLTET